MYRVLVRSVQNSRLLMTPQITKQLRCASKSSGDDTSDDENRSVPKQNEEDKAKSSEALKKLNLLLQKIIDEDASIAKSDMKLDLAKPKRFIRTKSPRTEPGVESVKKEPIEQAVVSAAKDVAKSLGGDVKQTESELLSKLLNPIGEGDKKTSNLSELIVGMKIDRETKSTTENTASRAYQVRQILGRTQEGQRASSAKTGASTRRQVLPRPAASYSPIDLFGEEPLGIFKPTNEPPETGVKLETWEKLQRRELRLSVTHPPSNYFEQMILWTEQGKIWKFPINNEQGMEAENKVYFADHVFIEKHLEPWCPSKGPIRHFMELVCVGLSKNPYLSAEHKRDHILWYKDYFEDKKELLKEVGAIPSDTPGNPKSIE